MRLIRLPTGTINDRDRTWFLSMPFDRFLEPRVIPRPRLVSIGARAACDVSVGARIAGRDVTVGPRIDAEVNVQ